MTGLCHTELFYVILRAFARSICEAEVSLLKKMLLCDEILRYAQNDGVEAQNDKGELKMVRKQRKNLVMTR